MSRFLKELDKYSDSLTLKELKEKVISDMNAEEEKNKLHFLSIQNEYRDVYLKRYTDTIYGETLEIIHIENIISSKRTENWELIYHFKGVRISFSQRDIYFKEINGNENYDYLTEYELKNIEKISVEDYDEYHSQYTDIYTRLNLLMNGYQKTDG